MCTLPAAGALKSQFPECEITWIVDPRFRSIADRCAHVTRVVAHKPSLKLSELPRLEDSFDAAFDMQGLLKSALPIWKAEAGKKLGYHWQREGSWLFTTKVKPDPSSIHIVDQYVDVARVLAPEAESAEFGLKPTAEDDESVIKLLAEVNVSGKFIVMNPGAAWVTKRWPATSFAEVSQNLVKRGLNSVVIGSNSDTDIAIADEVVNASGGAATSVAGKTNIAQLISLIAKSAAHLGGDTGSTHIAAALGIPAIGLYSITRPERSCPYGQFDRCLYNQSSLQEITVDQVLAKFEVVCK